jgi:hypothetical protein
MHSMAGAERRNRAEMAGTTGPEPAASAVTVHHLWQLLEITGHGWLPKPRFGTLGNNYWTMNGPRNGLCTHLRKCL